MSEIQRIIDEMLRVEIHREFMRAFEEDIAVPPNWQGFRGIKGVFDEAIIAEFDFWSHRPKQFTPEEFSKMWDSFTEYQKVNYVLILIT